jgi:hypothetical protein
MSRRLFVLWNDDFRARAIDCIKRAPKDTRVTFQAPRRTTDQNAKMWSMLGEVSEQLPWHGSKLSSDDWKLMFLDALNRELRIAPSLDGRGFVNLGRSSSDLSKDEMADLITLIDSFAAQHGVKLFEPERDAKWRGRNFPSPSRSL